MKVSWNCLNELIDLKNVTPASVAQKITLSGFEIESITDNRKNRDIILETSVTANRQDIKGIIDIAIEIHALIEAPLKVQLYEPNFEKNTTIQKLQYSNSLDQLDELYAVEVRDISIENTDQRIKNYSGGAANIKNKSNILDIIEFINLKWGQEIIIYILSNNDEKIQRSELGNLQISGIDKYTKKPCIKINNKTLIELNSNNIKEKLKNPADILIVNYQDKKEARFNQYSLFAYQEVFNILSKVNNKIITPEKIYTYNNKRKYKNIICSINRINKILGPIAANERKKSLDDQTITKILSRLNFKTHTIDNHLSVNIPTEREKEIENNADIAEEIGRIYGFNNFLDELPKFQQKTNLSEPRILIKKIRRILRSMGLHELINSSIQNKKNNSCLEIVNPISQEQKILRTNIIDQLFSNKLENINQNNGELEGFEIGKVFYKKIDREYKEEIHVSCLIGNSSFNRSKWKEATSELSWFQAKGITEELIEKIKAKVSWSTKKHNSYLTESLKQYVYPEKSIYILNNDEAIGVFSEIKKQAKKTLGNDIKSYFFEINISKLAKTIKPLKHLDHRFIAYSNYPKINRDFSIKIKADILINQIIKIINTIKKQKEYLIESVVLLNEYYNSKTTKTICLRITYRSQEKTLTHEEVEILDNIFKNKLHKAISSKT